jgi:thiol-disulfide isomerase/thioredoxin
MSRPMRPLAPLLALALLVAGCSGTTASPPPEAPAVAPAPVTSSPDSPAISGGDTSGAYLSFADYERDASAFADDDVVLFFAAPWCSSCRQTRTNIEADLAGIPAGLVIVVVDYDTATDLRRRYGVTVQHTFVQIAADGEEIKKWTGTLTAQAIAEQTI